MRGMFDGIGDKIAEHVIPGMVCGYLRQYAGQNCQNLKVAICLNMDIFDLWVQNAEKEGIRTLADVQNMTRKAPKARNLVTTTNVRKWLLEEGMTDIIKTVDTTPGGTQWFEWTVMRFREGLWE